MRYNRYRGPYTKSYVRKLARQQGYRLASPAQATKTGLFAEVWVWGWDESRQRVITCRYQVGHDHPDGHCNYPPVSDTVRAPGGIAANQLQLDIIPKKGD